MAQIGAGITVGAGYNRALTDAEANQNFKHYQSRFGL